MQFTTDCHLASYEVHFVVATDTVWMETKLATNRTATVAQACVIVVTYSVHNYEYICFVHFKANQKLHSFIILLSEYSTASTKYKQ